MSDTWHTSVDGLVRSFLSALNALVPSMHKARILDDNLIGFDDWARVTDLLYDVLVVEPIRNSLDKSQRAAFDLPLYDTEYESYEDFSLIRATGPEAIKSPASLTDNHIFYRFNTDSKLFNQVETIKLNRQFQRASDSYRTHDINEVVFSCLVPQDEGCLVLDEIEVPV